MFGKKSIYEEKKETGLYANTGVKAKAIAVGQKLSPIAQRVGGIVSKGTGTVGELAKREAQTQAQHWNERRQARHEASLDYIKTAAHYNATHPKAVKPVRVTLFNEPTGKRKKFQGKPMRFDPFWGWK